MNVSINKQHTNADAYSQPQEDTVSVALAVYNGATYLADLLASLEAQTRKPFELVVLDDGSSDNSLEIIRNYPLSFTKKVFANDKNIGPVLTFKKLATLCSGNHIAFCDQDDIWLPEKLEASVTEIKKINPGIPGLVFTDLSVIDQEGKLIYPSFWKLRHTNPSHFSLTDILYGNIVTGCTIMANRMMADELAHMPSSVFMHDWWMALLAFSFGEYRFVEEPMVLFRSHAGSVTTKNKLGLVKRLLENYKRRSEYLSKNISQAIEFKQLYSPRLTAKQNEQLDRFISLREKNIFYKAFARNMRSLQRRIKYLYS